MKQFAAFMMVLCLLSCGVNAMAEIPSIERLTQEELVELRGRIDAKIEIADKGTVLLDEDGYTITWMGFDAPDPQYDHFYHHILLVTNSTDETVYFSIDSPAVYNNFQIGMHSNWGMYAIEPGMTLVTSSISWWHFAYSNLDAIGMTIDDINEVQLKYSFYDSECYDEEEEHTIKCGVLKFAIQ